MRLLFALIILAGIGGVLGLPLLEFAVGMLVILPLAWFLLMSLAGSFSADLLFPSAALSALTYCGLFLVIVGVLFRIRRGCRKPWREAFSLDEFLPILVLCIVYGIALGFAHARSDFVAIGERLRDYALLASAIRSPLVPEEPWMAGTLLNYYVYWYRFGQMLSAVLGEPVWEIYHMQIALALALYAALAYRLLFLLGFFRLSAILSTLAIAFGSNVAGFVAVIEGDKNWWGPSRLIKGGITEFPGWSFLLGDLHPHYADLPLMPFLLLHLFWIFHSNLRPLERLLSAFGTAAGGYLWFYAANAWEAPMWVLVLGVLAVGFFRPLSNELLNVLKDFRAQASPRAGLLAISYLVLLIGLWLSGRQIIPENAVLRLVRDPVARTKISELLLHFGIPLVLGALAALSFVRERFAAVAAALVLILAAFFAGVGLFIVLLAALILWLLVFRLAPSRTVKETGPAVLFLAGLALIAVPEFVFIDDVYGGENERMNTIFKIYFTAWFFLHAGAFALVRQTWTETWTGAPQGSRSWKIKNAIGRTAPVWCTAVMLLFIVRFAPHVRRVRAPTFEPASAGLSAVQSRFPGSGEAIQHLVSQPQGITIEAQGESFTYTAFVSTLGNKPSYLGWPNHVRLLSKEDAEAARRFEFTDNFYTQADCAERRRWAQNEHIAYVVLGNLELVRYDPELASDWSCFQTDFAAKNYRILKP